MEGAIFGLFAKEDIKSETTGKVLIEADEIIELKSTDEEGKITFVADLPIGATYYVKELYAKMLKQQLAKGNNGLVKSKYITFSIEADNIREAKPKLERIESDILNNFKILGVPAYPLNGVERLQILYETFNPDNMTDFQFDYGSMIRTGLNTKDYVAPTSFVFKDRNTFRMGNTIGAVSYLQILAPELTDKMLAEFLDIDKNLIVNQ